MRGWILFTVLILIAAPTAQISAQTNDKLPEITTADEAAEWLKQLYSHRDFKLGVIEGERLAEEFSGDVEIDALRIVNMARAGMLKEAQADAKSLYDRYPDHPWVLYAKAVTLRWDEERRVEALKYIEKGLEIAPEMTDLHTLHIAWLNAMDKKNEALEAALQSVDIAENPVEVMQMKSFMMYQLVTERDDITLEDTFDSYKMIRELEPDNFSAHYFAGSYYISSGQVEKGLELQRRAAEISTAPRVSSRYWTSLIRLGGYSQEENLEIIRETAESLKQRRPETPELLMSIASAHDMNDMTEKRNNYFSMIEEKYYDSPEMEWVLIYRSRDFRSEHSDAMQAGDQEIIDEYRQMLWSLFERPEIHNTHLKGGVYLDLFRSYQNDEYVNTNTLSILLEGMVEYNTANPHIVFGEAPVTYVEKGGDVNQALELANRGFDAMRRSVEQRNQFMPFSSDEEFEREIDRSNAIIHSAIGRIHYLDGDLEKAEKYLVKSNELSPGNRSNLYRLGRLYEALEQPENAESFYIMGVGTTGMGDNPNEDALKELYEKTHGSPDGYDDYLERVLADDRETRRERILADRHENPETPPDFELNDIKGNSVSSEIMDGKVVAINFWGKWCAPCVAEMPDIQELYEKYSEDEDVLILTINNDNNLHDLIEWMDEHEYTFPTLRDDGYNTKAGVGVYPTTWFLDRNGSIIYTQLGYTSELVDEFSWRIEELR